MVEMEDMFQVPGAKFQVEESSDFQETWNLEPETLN